MNTKILLLTDYEDGYWLTYDSWTAHPRSLDIGTLVKYFKRHNFSITLSSYKAFDFSVSYSDFFVLYGSSEDLCGGTKDYMEDVLVFLMQSGATLIPSFEFFRAHHNKVMMEMLRHSLNNDAIHSAQAKTYRSLKDLDLCNISYPVVLKCSAGTASKSVLLIHNEKQLIKSVKKISRIPSEKVLFFTVLRKIKRRLDGKPDRYNLYNTKFILQPYIPNLGGDYKVLVFWDHYFVLYRLNRKNDFRASGSGKFCEPDPTEIDAILQFAKGCYESINTPHLSLDIAFDKRSAHLIEYQCIAFGFKAMCMSEYHFVTNGDRFERVEGRVNAEEEYAYSVVQYIDSRYGES